ncbi:MFS transporter [Streptosporangium carneum]|uniref:MFS transporter n=1 Tax=Streptosporangium carneum TaxID=47481 RepID=UPI0022F2E502|nr:MFS transporter [Streptosporangium carneum]
MYKNLTARPGPLLAAVAVAQFIAALDMSVVNVALPAIRTGLGFGQAELQWVVHAYALTFGGFLLLGGRMSDLYGRRSTRDGAGRRWSTCPSWPSRSPWQPCPPTRPAPTAADPTCSARRSGPVARVCWSSASSAPTSTAGPRRPHWAR